MEVLNWLVSAFPALCGGSAIFTLIIYRKQQKRFKAAEAFEKEVVGLKVTMEVLQRQIEFYEARLNSLQELIVNKDIYIAQLSAEKHTIEVKHARNKSAINHAYGCAFCPDKKDCPVLIQRAKNEEEYLHKIEKQ